MSARGTGLIAGSPTGDGAGPLRHARPTPSPALEHHAAARGRQHRTTDQRPVGHVGIVAGILDDAGLVCPSPPRDLRQIEDGRSPFGQDDLSPCQGKRRPKAASAPRGSRRWRRRRWSSPGAALLRVFAAHRADPSPARAPRQWGLAPLEDSPEKPPHDAPARGALQLLHQRVGHPRRRSSGPCPRRPGYAHPPETARAVIAPRPGQPVIRLFRQRPSPPPLRRPPPVRRASPRPTPDPTLRRSAPPRASRPSPPPALPP